MGEVRMMCESVRSQTVCPATATIPDDLTNLIEGAVKAGILENESDAIRHVLR
jgi:hypothetical protein